MLSPRLLFGRCPRMPPPFFSRALQTEATESHTQDMTQRMQRVMMNEPSRPGFTSLDWRKLPQKPPRSMARARNTPLTEIPFATLKKTRRSTPPSQLFILNHVKKQCVGVKKAVHFHQSKRGWNSSDLLFFAAPPSRVPTTAVHSKHNRECKRGK